MLIDKITKGYPMFYLFNTSAALSSSSFDIFIDKAGRPVFASHVSSEFSAAKDIEGKEIPPQRTLAGSFEASSLADNQLSRKGALTELGTKYCEAMGVEKDFGSLIKFIETTKHSRIDIELLKAQPQPS
jgi:hypothetical protein